MSGLTSRAHLIRKCTYPTSLISSSLTQLGASYAQKGFPKLTLIKHQTSASEHCRCPFCFDILMKEHSVITFLHLGWLILSYLSDSLLGLSPLNYFGITLEFAGPVFLRSTLLKTTDIQFFATYGLCTFAIIGFARPVFSKINVVENNGSRIFATYGLCVWGQPLFRRAFIFIFISSPTLLQTPNSQSSSLSSNFSSRESSFFAIGPLCVGATPVPKGFHFISCLLLILIRISKQGHTASLTHRVQWSYGLGWDIRADHPDVPAVYHHE